MQQKKVRVIIMTVVFVILLCWVAYTYLQPAETTPIDPVQEPVTEDPQGNRVPVPPPQDDPEKRLRDPNEMSEIPPGGVPG